MINLLVTLNSNYIPPLTVMLRSLMLADPAEEFTVFVAHSSLTASDIAAVEAAVDLSRTKICPIEIDPQLMNDAPVLKRITKETYYRRNDHYTTGYHGILYRRIHMGKS